MHVYQVELRDSPTDVTFIEPSTKVVGLTGEAPRGFDGGYIIRKPALPCLVFSHLPNRLLETEDDVAAFKADYVNTPRKAA